MKRTPFFLTPRSGFRANQVDGEDAVPAAIAADSEADSQPNPATNTESNPEINPQPDNGDNFGMLQISVTSAVNNRPIAGATVRISYSGDPNSTLQVLTTDRTGQTPTIELPTPPLAYSMDYSAQQPYSEYTFQINADGFEPVVISGAELLPDVTAIQNVTLDPLPSGGSGTAELFVIGPHTLYGDFPPKIIEAETKPVNETGEIVLSRVVIPEYIVVHDGPPSDSSAKDYYVPYRDYIKNVASSEIYATWPEAAIYANILAIQSFTLNRVYTEWYRNHH